MHPAVKDAKFGLTRCSAAHSSKQSTPEVRLQVRISAARRLVWHAAGPVLWQEGRQRAEQLLLRRSQLDGSEVGAVVVVPAAAARLQDYASDDSSKVHALLLPSYFQ